jgi:FkbM family methyltransferase
LKTAHKMALARLAYRATKLGRALFGLPDNCQVTRAGLRYDLDLSEGIDFAIFLLGSFEPSTVAALRRYLKRGATALDIGANIGAHTLQMARLVGPEGRVLSFEPTAFAFAKQLRNLALNPEICDRVTALQCFLTADERKPAPQSLYASWPLPHASWPLPHRPGVHGKHFGRSMITAGARTVTLDDLLLQCRIERIDLVKLDVDGFECEVLSGATQMMARDRPTFIMELAPYMLVERGATLAEFLNFFIPLNYRLYDEQAETELPSAPAALERMIGEGSSRNVVARIK